ncbi:hypothetical protein ACFL6N_05030 [Thermodesulfobacteriota bacterium]
MKKLVYLSVYSPDAFFCQSIFKARFLNGNSPGWHAPVQFIVSGRLDKILSSLGDMLYFVLVVFDI